MEFSHIPVLLQPCLDGLNIDPAGIYLDGTAGGAGHSTQIAKRLTTGRLISLDQDPDAVAVATERLKGLPAQVVQANSARQRVSLRSLTSRRSTVLCWTSAFPATSWTTRHAASPTMPTPRWICA